MKAIYINRPCHRCILHRPDDPMAFCRDLLDKNIEEREGKTATYDPGCPPQLLKVRVRVRIAVLFVGITSNTTLPSLDFLCLQKCFAVTLGISTQMVFKAKAWSMRSPEACGRIQAGAMCFSYANPSHGAYARRICLKKYSGWPHSAGWFIFAPSPPTTSRPCLRTNRNTHT